MIEYKDGPGGLGKKIDNLVSEMESVIEAYDAGWWKGWSRGVLITVAGYTALHLVLNLIKWLF